MTAARLVLLAAMAVPTTAFFSLPSLFSRRLETATCDVAAHTVDGQLEATPATWSATVAGGKFAYSCTADEMENPVYSQTPAPGTWTCQPVNCQQKLGNVDDQTKMYVFDTSCRKCMLCCGATQDCTAEEIANCNTCKNPVCEDVEAEPCDIEGRSVVCSNHGTVHGCHCVCDNGWGGVGQFDEETNTYTSCYEEQRSVSGTDSVAVNNGSTKNSGSCFDDATCTLMMCSVATLGVVATCCCACGCFLRNMKRSNDEMLKYLQERDKAERKQRHKRRRQKKRQKMRKKGIPVTREQHRRAVKRTHIKGACMTPSGQWIKEEQYEEMRAEIAFHRLSLRNGVESGGLNDTFIAHVVTSMESRGGRPE